MAAIHVSKPCPPHWMAADWVISQRHWHPRGLSGEPSSPGRALGTWLGLGAWARRWQRAGPHPAQGGVRQPLTAASRTAASPLCELHRVYSRTSLFHSSARAINRPAGTAEPLVAGAGGRGGRGMAVMPWLCAGRAPQVPPWWLGAQPFP